MARSTARPGSQVAGPSWPSWMRPLGERLSPIIKALLVIETLFLCFYALVKPVQPFFELHLALGPAALRGEPWQLATSLFVHLDFLGFVFNVIGLWFVGATIERALGTRRFVALLACAGGAASLCMAGIDLLLARPQVYAGSGPAVLALFVAFGTIYQRRPARVLGSLVLEARLLVALVVGFAFLSDLLRGAWGALGGDVVSVVVGFLVAGGGRGPSLARWWHGLRARRARRRYRIIAGGRPGKIPYIN